MKPNAVLNQQVRYTLRNKTKEFLFYNAYNCDDRIIMIGTGDGVMLPPCSEMTISFAGFTSDCPAQAMWSQAAVKNSNGSTTTNVQGEITGEAGRGNVKVDGKLQANVTNVYNWSESQSWVNTMTMVAGYLEPYPTNVYSYGASCECYNLGDR